MNFPTQPVEAQVFKSLLEEKIKRFAAKKPLEISELAISAGLNESTLYKIFERGSARPKTLEKIAVALDIDPKLLLPDVKLKYSQVDVGLLSEPDPIYNTAVVRAQKAQLYLHELPEKDAESYIPYYDVEITAGKLEQVFDDAEEMPAGYIYAPQYHDCIACNVKGDSMYDRIFPGSRLYVYQLRNKKYIDFGHIYLVVLDGYRLLKYIDPDPVNEDRVILRSHNSEQYKNWPVEKADILHLFLVKGYENQNAN